LVAGFEARFWGGVGVPKNTPANIIEKLNGEITADSGLLASPLHVMAGLVLACPGHPRLSSAQGQQDVDGRDNSAFTRVSDALCAGMTTERLTQFERKSL
jgi:hypothetical protein